MGGDHEVQSDFQLIAGTNRDLALEVAAGRFREDLYARINLWTYALPGLSERPEDIEPNLDYLLRQFSAEHGDAVRFNKEAREQFMAFAASPDARWSGNFRDLSAAVTRMATLAEAGRITTTVASAEIARLQRQWRTLAPAAGMAGRAGGGGIALDDVIGQEAAAQLDLFDRVQLEAVLAVCRQSKTMSDAGRKLYAVSRAGKAKPNDADRLRKYLARFGLDWEQLS
jgi:transcriptional regulatory protein RtcR